MKNNSHGGNIYKKAKELGMDENKILDYSANISPLGLPEYIRNAIIAAIDGTINYPDPECNELRKAISKEDGVEPQCISCGNGGADMLYRLAFGLKPKKVLLPVPAFVEYEEAMTAAGAEMVYYAMKEDLLIREDITEWITPETDLVIICNPNNPTGLLTKRELIIKVLEKAKKTDTMVMIDECFLEICREEAEYTVKPWIEQYDNLMILKSFTKLYAIPGVRLGYLLSGNPQIIEKVNRSGQAWSVSHIAQCAGVAALGNPEYKQAVIDTVEKELDFMKEELKKLPLTLYDGKANYLFFRTSGITDLDKQLEHYGIMIRNCSNYVNLGNDYWRVAVKAHGDNLRLIAALKEILL